MLSTELCPFSSALFRHPGRLTCSLPLQVADSWSADEDSEDEEAKAEAARLKAEQAKVDHKPKTERIAEHQARRAAEKAAAAASDDDSDDEDPAARRARDQAAVIEADMEFASMLLGDGPSRRDKHITVSDGSADPSNRVDFSTLPIFKPTNKEQFDALRQVLVPLITANSSRLAYSTFVQDLVRDVCGGLRSDAIKKITTSLTVLSNEKMRSEKSDKGGNKKTKAAKTKVSVNVESSDMINFEDNLDGYVI